MATFVLKLFLPIVTFVFGLFWLLKLKFCLPPSVQLETALAAELDAVPGGIEAALRLDIDVLPEVDQVALEQALRAGLNPPSPGRPVGTVLTAEYTNDPLVELLAGQGLGQPDDAVFPVFATPPEYTGRVTRDQVRHP